MRQTFPRAAVLGLGILLVLPASAAPIYNNLTPNNSMAMASRPNVSAFEIETADDFLLTSTARIFSASFTGLVVGAGGTPSVSDIVVEIYRVFPLDSTVPPSGNVPTRNNSPSDVALASRDSAAAELTFNTLVLSPTFTALNSIQPGGIHASTGGNGPVSGQEVQFNVTFTTPFGLPPDHYFFVPQVALNAGQFYWLSASRPIVGPGTTPFTPDLQAWTRDAALDPDWLRVGSDIVGGTTPPTFNAAFALDGVTVPEPATCLLVGIGLAGLVLRRRQEP